MSPRLDKAIQIQDMLQQLERKKMAVLHPKTWLILEGRTQLWWGPDRGGYFRNITDAGLYTEEEAKKIASNPDPNRHDEAVPLEGFREGIERLYHTLNPHEFLPSEVKK